MSKSFWDFFIPQTQAGIEGAKGSAEEAGFADEHSPISKQERLDWSHKMLDAATDQLDEARDQTLQQIAERDRGTYNPDNYQENGKERSVHHPKHPDYEPPMTAAERRAAHRKTFE